MKPNKISALLFICAINLTCKNEVSNQNLFADSNSINQKINKSMFHEGQDFLVFKRNRVLDLNGYSQPVEAISFLLPKGWVNNGGITWNWSTCIAEVVKLNFTSTSPDGNFQLQLFPVRQYIYNENPQILYGLRNHPLSGCDVSKPINANEYITYKLAPSLSASIINVETNTKLETIFKENAQKLNSQTQGPQSGVVNMPFASIGHLKLQNNKEAIVICNVSQEHTYVPDYVNGGFNTTIKTTIGETTMISFPTGKKEEAEKYLAIAKGSTKIQPQWIDDVTKLFSEIFRNEQVQTAKRQAIWYNASQEQNKAIVRNWETSNTASDRINEAWSQTIRDVETYKDDNGNAYELSAGYQSAWTSNDGSILLAAESNFDPNVELGDAWKKLAKK
jgi:hypothetical protein